VPWIWFLIGYGVLVASLSVYAAHVALSCRNARRRADAYKVLKLIWSATGATGVIAVLIRLHEVGVF
jgi:hypothetical protein